MTDWSTSSCFLVEWGDPGCGWGLGAARRPISPPSPPTHNFADRGEGAFGDILYGSCGFWEVPDGSPAVTYDDLPWGRTVAAMVDQNFDHPGTAMRHPLSGGRAGWRCLAAYSYILEE